MSTRVSNRQFILASRCEGPPRASDFRLVASPMPQSPDGGLLVQNLFLSLDPYLRGRIAGKHLSGAIAPGDLMPGETIGRVVSSACSEIAAGTLVRSLAGGWQDYVAVGPEAVSPLPDHGLSPSLALGVLGMPGLTAYAGMTRLADMAAGDVVLVSAAAGPVGSTVGQLARLAGCTVIGIAGGADKCAWAVDEAGFDHCLDHRAPDLRARLAAVAPNGIDIYFDNVGGDILQIALEQLALNARVILCGLMAQYNEDETPPGPNPGLIIKARATVRGLVVYDHQDLAEEAARTIAGHIRDGRFAVKEDIAEGLEAAPDQFVRLMTGQTFGKTLVHLAK